MQNNHKRCSVHGQIKQVTREHQTARAVPQAQMATENTAKLSSAADALSARRCRAVERTRKASETKSSCARSVWVLYSFTTATARQGHQASFRLCKRCSSIWWDPVSVFPGTQPALPPPQLRSTVSMSLMWKLSSSGWEVNTCRDLVSKRRPQVLSFVPCHGSD